MAKDIIIESKPFKVKKKPRVISLNDFMRNGRGRDFSVYQDTRERRGIYNPLRGSGGDINWRVPQSYGEVFSSDIDVGDKVWAFNPPRGKYGRGVIMNIMWEGFAHDWLYQVQFEGDSSDTWTNKVNKAVVL